MTLKYFTLSEFNCKETGENRMNMEFLEKLDKLREACGFPFSITSGYRSPQHSIERKKSTPGTHTLGIAADIIVADGSQRFIITEQAIALGFSGIGVADDFIHVDTRKTTPVLWCY
jgi:uncharacterized protein YcbK (DUF882 family)